MKSLALALQTLIAYSDELPYKFSSKAAGLLGAIYVPLKAYLVMTGQGQAAKDAEATAREIAVEIKVAHAKRAEAVK